jgi:tetratricopeptide (TPR) repeat protein
VEETRALTGYSNANFVTSAATTGIDRKGDLQILFNLGRRQRMQKNYAQATKNFALVLERNPPEETQRAALLELAVIAEEEGQLPKAQQILAQYIKTFPDDPQAPELVLRQGLLYRKMGASTLALSKFYSVISSVLSVKAASLDRYKRLVLMAQTEIADTYYLDGRHAEAAEYLHRLLKLDEPDLDKAQIQFKVIQCLAAQRQHTDTVAQTRDFLQKHPTAPHRGEVHFLLASALKQQGQNVEALQQVLALLRERADDAAASPADWAYWQQRTGNEIANRLYQDGDYVAALDIYNNLISLNSSPAWRVPVWYQIGLVYERLRQPAKAIEIYKHILGWQKDIADPSPNLKTIMDLAKWRSDFLDWQTRTDRAIESSPIN